MSAVDRFRQAWEAKFPSEPPPDLPCLHADLDQVRPDSDSFGSVYGTVYSRLNPTAVEHALQVCNATIAQLHLQLERQQFVAEYLWEVLHGIRTASFAEPDPSPPVLEQRFTPSVKDRAVAVSHETYIGAAGSRNSGLDSIIPILESPSSDSFSPPTIYNLDGKVAFSEDKAAGVTNAESNFNTVPACNRNDLSKHRSVTRQQSLPLRDKEQNNLELELDSERTFVSLDSKPQSVADTGESSTVTSLDSFRHQPVAPSSSLPGVKTHRQKPVPTPRSTVNRQAVSSVVLLGDANVGDSSTDDATSSGGNDLLLQPQREPQHVGLSDSFKHLSPKDPVQGEAAESVPAEDGDVNRIRSVKERALAFALSNAGNTPPSSSVPGTAPKLAISDNSLPPSDSALPRVTGRRTARLHVYEEVIPVKSDTTDSDEAEAGAVSSDDEEPLYYNLKMLQQTYLNRAKTFYSKGAQRPKTGRSKETDAGGAPRTYPNQLDVDDAQQLSSDSSKYIDINVRYIFGQCICTN